MTEELPEIESFTANVARLHWGSLAQSPGKFGFPITTYMGPLPQDNTWCDTWEECFKRGMKRMLDLERNVQGPSEELEKLTEQLYEKVIPRLLRPLTVLKSIKPVLIHGDLWYGNCCTDNATGKPIVFDACVFWAHNECKDHLFNTNSLPVQGIKLPFSFTTFTSPLLTFIPVSWLTIQTKSALGEPYDIGSESRISKRTKSISLYLLQRKIMMIEMHFTRCMIKLVGYSSASMVSPDLVDMIYTHLQRTHPRKGSDESM
jgi:Fructosamine kinase